MKKDFDGWNENKKKMNDQVGPFYHAREIWWCALGVNIGFEQDGGNEHYNRPVLILKGLSKETCIVIPLTTSTHDHKLRPEIGLIEGEKARAIISQMRVIDSRRLVRKMVSLDKNIFDTIRKIVKDIL